MICIQQIGKVEKQIISVFEFCIAQSNMALICSKTSFTEANKNGNFYQSRMLLLKS